MIEVEVEVLSTELPDLRARYDREARLIEVPVIDGVPWPHGVNVVGLLIIDLTSDLAIANFDVLVPRTRWRPGLPALVDPAPPGLARLRITPEAVLTQSLDGSVDVFRSRDGSTVQVLIGEPSRVSVLALTTSCQALIADRKLFGFQLTLSR